MFRMCGAGPVSQLGAVIDEEKQHFGWNLELEYEYGCLIWEILQRYIAGQGARCLVVPDANPTE